MTWESFYLVCFLVGFLLSAVSFLVGSLDLHLPGHFDTGHLDVHVDTGDAGGHNAVHVHHVSPLNFGTIAAFLAWFGGAGFLLERYSKIWAYFALGLALLSGLAGGAVMFWFLAKVLMTREENLNPADFEMIGVLGRVSSPIRPSGVGEIIFSQAGVRRSAPACSEDGSAIEKDSEVLVTRYEKGIAYVQRWEDAQKL